MNESTGRDPAFGSAGVSRRVPAASEPATTAARRCGLVLGLAVLCGCVAPVDLEHAPCPCGEDYYCCPHDNTCLLHDDSSCFSSAPLFRPAPLCQFDAGSPASSIAVDGGRAFVATTGGAVVVLGLADAAAPSEVGRYASFTEVGSIAVSGDVALLAAAEDGLLVVDFTDATSPKLLAQVAARDRAASIRVGGRYAYLADQRAGVQVLDIGSPEQPRVVANVASRGVTVRDSGTYVSASRRVFVDGNRAYIADGDGGVNIVEVTDPQSPMHIARYPENRYESIVVSEDAVVAGAQLFIADSKNGLSVVDITEPLSPELLGTAALPCTSLALVGHHVALATPSGWVLFVEVANPRAPQLVGAYDARGAVTELRYRDELLYVAASGGGVHVLTVGDL